MFPCKYEHETTTVSCKTTAHDEYTIATLATPNTDVAASVVVTFALISAPAPRAPSFQHQLVLRLLHLLHLLLHLQLLLPPLLLLLFVLRILFLVLLVLLLPPWGSTCRWVQQ